MPATNQTDQNANNTENTQSNSGLYKVLGVIFGTSAFGGVACIWNGVDSELSTENRAAGNFLIFVP